MAELQILCTTATDTNNQIQTHCHWFAASIHVVTRTSICNHFCPRRRDDVDSVGLHHFAVTEIRFVRARIHSAASTDLFVAADVEPRSSSLAIADEIAGSCRHANSEWNLLCLLSK